ncbi:hypothetical protein A5645_25990 [Mycobacterium asiaticum]|uniref:PE family protein n=1 Tax=Mycobacterium asiaticum TaxID=1790 RepID=UPI0007EFC69C|nr:PE family protein [Mycobacterium asiaticum]OBK91802.1 hypothetical protein A5645_25990 [Mycobacterium asiaticum]
MSFVFAAPELVEAAAQNLAGISSSLGQATAAAAAPTTGILAAGADEVSAAIAQLFGTHGQEFQALSAQAAAFHQEFVGMLNAGASAYASAEASGVQALMSGASGGMAPIGNLGQTISTAIQAEVQGISGVLGGAPSAFGVAAGMPAAIQDLNAFGAAVAAPYQALAANTTANLQAIHNTFAANPFPFLNQVVNNQVGYAQQFATGLQGAIQNLPAELANAPLNIQASLQALASANPAAFLQQVANNQINFAQTIVTGLTTAGHDLGTGLSGLPASFQTAFQDLVAGNVTGAANALGQGLENVFLPGFQDISFTLGDTALIPITPLGPLGDLLPIFSIPGQMAQNFTNLLPAASIPGQIAQHATNVLDVLTNFGSTFDPTTLGINFGLPLRLLFDGIGAPINGLVALNSSMTAFVSAVQTGNVAGAAAAVLDAPAVFADGFLNGQTFVSLPPLTTTVDFGIPGLPPSSLTAVAELPLGGLLTPLSPIDSNIGVLPGTPVGGLIPGLLSFQSELAAAITNLM